MDLDTYLQRNSRIMTDLASDGAARAALDSHVVTDSSCDRPAGVSRGGPARQPLTEQNGSNNVTACRRSGATIGTAGRQGAAHRSSALPAANWTPSRPTSASVSGIIKQVLRQVDEDDITAALDGLQHGGNAALLPSSSEARRPAICATGAAVLTSRPELSARLAAARVQGLGKQLAECREALQQKSAELSAAAHEVAQLRKESAQLQQHAASLKAQLGKQAKAAADAQHAQATRDRALLDAATSQRVAEADTRRSSAEAAAKASDARLKQALAEIGRWKAAAENKRSAALEQASRQAVEGTRLHQDNERLQQQNAELHGAFRKQLQLIAVLKRQKIHLASAKALASSEQQFERILSQD